MNAQGTDRIVETYRDHTSTARRQHIHGPLQSTDKPMSLRESIAWCGFYAGITGLAIGFATGAFALRAEPASGLVADAHQSPIAGDNK